MAWRRLLFKVPRESSRFFFFYLEILSFKLIGRFCAPVELTCCTTMFSCTCILIEVGLFSESGCYTVD
jgi:hypothetical protein